MQNVEQCWNCADIQYDAREAIIVQLANLLVSIPPSPYAIRLGWEKDVHSRCAYGMHCKELKEKDKMIISGARQLDRKIMTIIKKGNPVLVDVVFNLLNGYFPYVANQYYNLVNQEYEVMESTVAC